MINVPHLHTNVFADLTVPHLRGLHLMPGWSYTSRKEATRDDAVSVPGYNLFNLGARYTPGGEQGRVTFHIYADNITNNATGPTPAPVTATLLSGSARHQPCGSMRTTLSRPPGISL